jgi:RNA polymerase sigma-70 factor, ECF subfamily
VHLTQFESRAQFSTWLTRITVYEALARRRKQRPEEPLSTHDPTTNAPEEQVSSQEISPERRAYAGELSRLLERAVDGLPDAYRTVFMLRDIEGLSTTETAEGLGVGEEAVKTRLHRARAMMRRSLTGQLGASASQAFQFHASRCDRIVSAVLAEIRQRNLEPR